MRAALELGHARGKMLYELRPDIMPYGYLTPKELELWGHFYKDLKERRNNG